MTRRLRGVRELLGAVLVASCAAPRDTHFTGYAAIPPGQARLYVYRPESATSTPRARVAVKLDARPLVELGRDEYASVALPPGEHRLAPRPMPARSLELHAGRATYCRVLAIQEGLVLVWDLRCSENPDEHADLRACSAAALDRTVDWQP